MVLDGIKINGVLYEFASGTSTSIETVIFEDSITLPSTTSIEIVGLKANTTYRLYAQGNVDVDTSKNGWYATPNPSPIHKFTDLHVGDTFEYTPAQDTTLKLRTGIANSVVNVKITTSVSVSEAISEIISNITEQKEEIAKRLNNRWDGKNVVLYGDSVTAQGNGDNEQCKNSFLFNAYKALNFANLYCRGVGGQTYMWNDKGYYCAVGGSVYLDRYKYDASGNKTNEVVEPATITQDEINRISSAKGTPIEVHYGCFCSWDRITSSIPESKRESIDLIILNGGSNDFSAVEDISVEGDIVLEEPTWISGNNTDVTWANSNFYKGGDYDITHFSGAIASTIMKMQIWCPNAVVILATPFAHYNANNQQKKNSKNMDFRQLCDIEVGIAKYVGTDVIDANGSLGLLGVDFITKYTTDGTHPNAVGRKIYGDVFIAKLNTISSR